MLNQASGPKQHRKIKIPMTPASQNRHKGQPVRGQPQSHPQSRPGKDCRRRPTPQKAPIPGDEGQFTPTPPEAGYPRRRPSRQEAPQVQGPTPLALGSAPHQSDQSPPPPTPQKPLPRESATTCPASHKIQYAERTVWGVATPESLTHYHTHSPDTLVWVINAQPIHRGGEKQLSFK